MKTAMLAGAAALALALPARATSLPHAVLSQTDVCTLAAPRALRTAMTPLRQLDCCPAASACATYLGTTAVPDRRQRVQG